MSEITIEFITNPSPINIDFLGAGLGPGTVTSVSVVTANGFSGTVASATTTPAITIDVNSLDASKIGAGTVSTTEFGYLDGVTSSIQTQLDGKQSLAAALTEISGLLSLGTRAIIYTPGAPPNYSLTLLPLSSISTISTQTILGNNLGLSSNPSALAITTVLDWLGSVQGDTLYRNASDWVRLPKGTAGQVLTMNTGATAPEWATKNQSWLIKSTTYTANSFEKIQTDTTGGAWTLTLPPSPSVGDEVLIEDAALNWELANLTIARNGLLINGDSSNFTANVSGGKLSCVYISVAYGWSIK